MTAAVEALTRRVSTSVDRLTGRGEKLPQSGPLTLVFPKLVKPGHLPMLLSSRSREAGPGFHRLYFLDGDDHTPPRVVFSGRYKLTATGRTSNDVTVVGSGISNQLQNELFKETHPEETEGYPSNVLRPAVEIELRAVEKSREVTFVEYSTGKPRGEDPWRILSDPFSGVALTFDSIGEPCFPLLYVMDGKEMRMPVVTGPSGDLRIDFVEPPYQQGVPQVMVE